MVSFETADSFRAGLRLLLEATDAASDTESDPWQFALEQGELLRAGLPPTSLRWLRAKGYVEQALEITLPGDSARSFRPLGTLLSGDERACYRLTSGGAEYARSLLATPRSPSPPAPVRPSQLPRWDARHRTLFVGTQVVKHFRVPSPVQEVLLAVFEEEGWPERIDDPLPPNKDGKRRLHSAINSLNRSQVNELLHFFGDGTGQCVCWRLLVDPHTAVGMSAEIDPVGQIPDADCKSA